MKNHVLQVNLKNRGGAFSIIYEASKKLYPDIIFDYFSDAEFDKNDIWENLIDNQSVIYDKEVKANRFIKQIKLYHELREVLHKEKYTIVHIHTDTAWKALLYVKASKKEGVRNIIVHSHSSGINGHFRCLNLYLHRIAKHSVSKLTTNQCACGRKAAEWMFTSPDDVKIIRNGVNEKKFRFDAVIRKNIRKKYRLCDDSIIIGVIGDYSYAKNPEFIAKLAQKLLLSSGNYYFLLIGEGNGKSLIERVNREHIIDAGQVTNVNEYLSAIDIFILPSRFEGLPMSAIEAQATGCYTLVSSNVTPETKCSIHYKDLPLDIDKWVDEIRNINFEYNRENQSKYLSIPNITIETTAEQLKDIYTETNYE